MIKDCTSICANCEPCEHMNKGLPALIDRCGANVKAKGFDYQDTLTQTLLIATEVAEALEVVGDTEAGIDGAYYHPLSKLKHDLIRWAITVESMRKRGVKIGGCRVDVEQESHLEEMADIVIRVLSYIGANGLTDDFIKVLLNKMDTNEGRPHMHGKGF